LRNKLRKKPVPNRGRFCQILAKSWQKLAKLSQFVAENRGFGGRFLFELLRKRHPVKV